MPLPGGDPHKRDDDGAHTTRVYRLTAIIQTTAQTRSHCDGKMMKAEQTRAPRVFNVNVGVLGHVDSGKTSLVRALSTELSTTALDKHPQSRERGMTLDLGFSAFTVEIPQRFKVGGNSSRIVDYALAPMPGPTLRPFISQERSQGQGSEG